MINIDTLYLTENISELLQTADKSDLAQLVDLLSEKDDKIRYQIFLYLQKRSESSDELYPYWDIFCDKMTNQNSYQRSIGLMLTAENTKWDIANKMDTAIDLYLSLLNDEKPITIRQCIQYLSKIIPYKIYLIDKITDSLLSFKITEVRETMQKSILLDILNVLVLIRKYKTSDSIEDYIIQSLTGGILDKKSVKEIQYKL